MPLPTKKKGEDKTTFMHRCMSDDHIQNDFKTQAQKVAVCMGLFRKAKKKKHDKHKASLNTFSADKINDTVDRKVIDDTIPDLEPNWDEVKEEINKDGFIQLD